MEISILSKIPESGEYDEIQFGVGNNVTWVLFVADDYTEWVGKFARGSKQLSKVIIIPNSSFFCVLAEGNFYCVDYNTKQIRFTFESDYVDDFIISDDGDFIVVTDGLRLFIYDTDNLKLIHETNRISWDGILLNTCQNYIVSGKVHDLSEEYCSCPFTFNILTNDFAAKYNVPPPV